MVAIRPSPRLLLFLGFSAESLVCLAFSTQGQLGAALEVVAEQFLSLFLVCTCWKANRKMNAGVVPATPTHNAFRQGAREANQSNSTSLGACFMFYVMCLSLGALLQLFWCFRNQCTCLSSTVPASRAVWPPTTASITLRYQFSTRKACAVTFYYSTY